MIKTHKIPEKILEHIDKARIYLDSHPKVIFAYLFGGLTKARCSPLSDVDIAVYIANGGDISQEKIEILGNLMELLNTDEIDLVILNTASLPLRAKILEEKKVLVDSSPFVRHKFESLTLREYFDFSIKEMEIYKKRYSI
ncbi:MAG: Nucleotidyltransferase domain protein [Candidatus Scalindua rubra]|uniref:Nucleotidyltransferase domain protein n=1 Tax=Candidatus Scalindua rubra TaxID=1872076 RepID=A0A1E3X898_9BACT|nr:MAG: Nucleotidyltransferase domain protein [Candidatus Scalindua rubra]